jgi:hypothetical protein
VGLNLLGERRIQQPGVNFDLHELPPMSLRAFNTHLGSLFQQISLVAQRPPSDLAAFLEQPQG